MIEELLHLATDLATEPELRELVAKHVQTLNEARRPNEGGLVARAEDNVRANPQTAFVFDSSGLATLTVDGASWCAGRFDTHSIGELRATMSAGSGAARL